MKQLKKTDKDVRCDLWKHGRLEDWKVGNKDTSNINGNINGNMPILACNSQFYHWTICFVFELGPDRTG